MKQLDINHLINNSTKKYNVTILNKRDLEKILPFGKTKLNALLLANILPVVKIGRDYITTTEQLNQWIDANIGKSFDY